MAFGCAGKIRNLRDNESAALLAETKFVLDAVSRYQIERLHSTHRQFLHNRYQGEHHVCRQASRIPVPSIDIHDKSALWITRYKTLYGLQKSLMALIGLIAPPGGKDLLKLVKHGMFRFPIDTFLTGLTGLTG